MFFNQLPPPKSSKYQTASRKKLKHPVMLVIKVMLIKVVVVMAMVMMMTITAQQNWKARSLGSSWLLGGLGRVKKMDSRERCHLGSRVIRKLKAVCGWRGGRVKKDGRREMSGPSVGRKARVQHKRPRVQMADGKNLTVCLLRGWLVKTILHR